MSRPVCDHLTLPVADLGASRRGEDFAIEQGSPPPSGMHIAFAVDSAAQVDAFHAAALTAGGRGAPPAQPVVGAPGERPQYHAGYYGAYVLDRAPPAKPVVGNNVEAVWHGR